MGAPCEQAAGCEFDGRARRCGAVQAADWGFHLAGAVFAAVFQLALVFIHTWYRFPVGEGATLLSAALQKSVFPLLAAFAVAKSPHITPLIEVR